MVQQGLALLAGEDDCVQRFVGAAEQAVEQEGVVLEEEIRVRRRYGDKHALLEVEKGRFRRGLPIGVKAQKNAQLAQEAQMKIGNALRDLIQ